MGTSCKVKITKKLQKKNSSEYLLIKHFENETKVPKLLKQNVIPRYI